MCSFSERAISTLRRKFQQYQTFTGAKKQIPWKQIVDGINATPHTITKIAPKDVTLSNSGLVFARRYRKHFSQPQDQEKPLAVNTPVRISSVKSSHFSKSQAFFSEEVFFISKVRYTNLVTYFLVDGTGEPILSSFYRYELQVAETGYTKHLRVRKVHSRKKNLLNVSYEGHPANYKTLITPGEFKAFRSKYY